MGLWSYSNGTLHSRHNFFWETSSLEKQKYLSSHSEALLVPLILY